MQDNGNSEGVGYLIIAQHFLGRGQVTLIKWMANTVILHQKVNV